MKRHVFDLARITVEFETPLTVGTGQGNDLQDSVCVCDAGGLPSIPGSSIAGALRHALAGPDGPDEDKWIQSMFGHQSGNRGSRSRLVVSWAQLHGRDNQPVAFRSEPTRSDDPVLAAAAAGVLRDHVRLNGAGVPDAHGKFDETLVPSGARFTFELRLCEADEPVSGEFDRLLSALVGLRLGGRTRRGFGRFRTGPILWRRFDLSTVDDRRAWGLLPRALERGDPKQVLVKRSQPSNTSNASVGATIALKARSYWMFGGGEPCRKGHSHGKRAVDQVPLSERRIVWHGDRGGVDEQPVYIVPASGVKGALSHRTAFHLRRLRALKGDTGCWHPLDPATEKAPGEQENPELHGFELLFGSAREGRGGQESSGRPGRLFLEDSVVADRVANEPKSGILQHVSLDRFTGGPMPGALFSEAPLHRGELLLRLEIDGRTRCADDQGVPPDVRKAFGCALDDLCEGRLALGAGAGRGHGTFKGAVRWTDGKCWLEGRS